VSTWAPGFQVEEESPFWTETFVRAWGRSLGTIHAVSVQYQPRGARRWHWREEGWIANAQNLFGPKDEEIRSEFAQPLDQLALLPELPGQFGLIHGDHWPANFNYDSWGRITHFDFENCRYHWFLADAIAGLGILRRLDGSRAGKQCDWFLEAYGERFDLAPEIWKYRAPLLRLPVRETFRAGSTTNTIANETQCPSARRMVMRGLRKARCARTRRVPNCFL
jgi:Ser/Thr protein kinase RdoA (MazF antagonist)